MVVPLLFTGRRDCTTFALAAALFLLAPAVSGQFSSGVNVVEVYAAVTDQNGAPVSGLQRDDFTVLEDGRAQTLAAFAEGDFPLSVALAIDRSFSMGARQLPTAVSAARTFLGELRSGDQAMIVAIGSEIEVVSPLSTDRAAQQRALGDLKPWGTTGLHDAIIESIDAIQAAKGRRALVLLSDGTDRYSTATAADALIGSDSSGGSGSGRRGGSSASDWSSFASSASSVRTGSATSASPIGARAASSGSLVTATSEVPSASGGPGMFG
jgi:hypothetical protein